MLVILHFTLPPCGTASESKALVALACGGAHGAGTGSTPHMMNSINKYGSVYGYAAGGLADRHPPCRWRR